MISHLSTTPGWPCLTSKLRKAQWLSSPPHLPRENPCIWTREANNKPWSTIHPLLKSSVGAKGSISKHLSAHKHHAGDFWPTVLWWQRGAGFYISLSQPYHWGDGNYLEHSTLFAYVAASQTSVHIFCPAFLWQSVQHLLSVERNTTPPLRRITLPTC